jgi:hypothetical protein
LFYFEVVIKLRRVVVFQVGMVGKKLPDGGSGFTVTDVVRLGDNGAGSGG